MLPIPSAERRPFLFAEYQDGRLGERPLECPCWDGASPCDVILHALRVRKTGPLFPLAVCRCIAHDIAFTVYPPGFFPYSRRSLTPVETVACSEPSFVEVAQDAASGNAWPRSGASQRKWSTLTRLLSRFATIFGISNPKIQELVALSLHLPLHLLAQLRAAAGYRDRGAAILAVIQHLDLDQLLLAGAISGIWGPPFRWQTAPARLVSLLPLPSRSKASTNSVPRGPPAFW